MVNNYVLDFPIKQNHIYFKIEIIIDIYLRNHSDVALEYLEIAFVAQKLSDISNIIKSYETPIINLYPRVVLIIEFEKESEIKINEILNWFSIFFTGEFDTDEDQIDAREEFVDFEDKIVCYSIIPVLPEYCDLYFANLIVSNYDWEPEAIQETLTLNPEWKFYTWKSSWSRKLGFDFYVSSEFWLLDINADLHCALMHASDHKSSFSSENLIIPTRVISDMNKIYIFIKDDVLCISLNLHFFIARCAEILFPFDEDKFQNTKFCWGISADFCVFKDYSLIVFKGGTFQYVIFFESIEILNINEIDKLTSLVQNLTVDLLERSSNSIKIKCNWSFIDDEIFEQLCYDLILRDGRFIPEETRRMGKSKSRDGGRDVLTFEKSHSGQNERRLWIIQCKYSKFNKSLGRNDIILSELIDEYKPYGVIIATNMIIDAGAYDKFDKIAINRNTEVKYWNGLWIERLLNRNPDLIRNYKLANI
jgi:hypothetical protein